MYSLGGEYYSSSKLPYYAIRAFTYLIADKEFVNIPQHI